MYLSLIVAFTEFAYICIKSRRFWKSGITVRLRSLALSFIVRPWQECSSQSWAKELKQARTFTAREVWISQSIEFSCRWNCVTLIVPRGRPRTWTACLIIFDWHQTNIRVLNLSNLNLIPLYQHSSWISRFHRLSIEVSRVLLLLQVPMRLGCATRTYSAMGAVKNRFRWILKHAKYRVIARTSRMWSALAAPSFTSYFGGLPLQT